jgi:hypothetical protein
MAMFFFSSGSRSPRGATVTPEGTAAGRDVRPEGAPAAAGGGEVGANCARPPQIEPTRKPPTAARVAVRRIRKQLGVRFIGLEV